MYAQWLAAREGQAWAKGQYLTRPVECVEKKKGGIKKTKPPPGTVRKKRGQGGENEESQKSCKGQKGGTFNPRGRENVKGGQGKRRQSNHTPRESKKKKTHRSGTMGRTSVIGEEGTSSEAQGKVAKKTNLKKAVTSPTH